MRNLITLRSVADLAVTGGVVMAHLEFQCVEMVTELPSDISRP